MSEQFLYFLQQMFNGVTLGSTYALIAIGYTMVYGIIGMINFAHGEVYMIGRKVRATWRYPACLTASGLWAAAKTFPRPSPPCRRLSG